MNLENTRLRPLDLLAGFGVGSVPCLPRIYRFVCSGEDSTSSGRMDDTLAVSMQLTLVFNVVKGAGGMTGFLTSRKEKRMADINVTVELKIKDVKVALTLKESQGNDPRYAF